MGKFDDYLNAVDLGSGIPDTFINDLKAAYQDDLSIHNAKVETLEGEKANLLTQLTEKDAEITSVKSKNFDLLMAIPNDNSNDAENQTQTQTDVESIDDLFD